MVSRAPIIEEISLNSEPWVRWFTDVSAILEPPNRDASTFTPVFTSLTETGTVTITGNFVRKGKILFFDVVVDPEVASTSSSTLGTTFFLLPSLLIQAGGNKDNSQDVISANGFGTLNGFNVETPEDFGAGYVENGTLKAFTPTWAATGDKVSVTGWVRIEGL